MKKLVLFLLLCASNPLFSDELTQVLKIYHDFPQKGIVFRDINPILLNPDLYNQVIDRFYAHYKEKQVEAIVALESRGLLFGSALAYKLKLPLVMVRKAGKLPGEIYSASYTKLYGEDIFEMQKGVLAPSQKVVIIDDFYSTGGSLNAAVDLVEASGAEVLEAAFLFNNPIQNKKAFDFPIFYLSELDLSQ